MPRILWKAAHMPSITLADIQAAADRKYGPLVIELADGPVELVNPIRLSKEKRKKLTTINDGTESGDVEGVEDKLADVIRLAMKPAEAKRLLAAVGGDLAQLKEIVETWTASAQVGEASPSPS